MNVMLNAAADKALIDWYGNFSLLCEITWGESQGLARRLPQYHICRDYAIEILCIYDEVDHPLLYNLKHFVISKRFIAHDTSVSRYLLMCIDSAHLTSLNAHFRRAYKISIWAFKLCQLDEEATELRFVRIL
jgi:hypothetical protein